MSHLLYRWPPGIIQYKNRFGNNTSLALKIQNSKINEQKII
jgi:hypothetical protein